jgi:riboflavin synthase
MFTGIVEQVGQVVSLSRRGTGGVLRLRAPMAGEMSAGESVAVNGACLTAESTKGDEMAFALSAETLARTSLGGLRRGASVNLERALAAGGRLGGHMVQGHVDCVTRVVSLRRSGETAVLTFEVPRAGARYVVEKGSVALDGVSLTVAGVRGSEATVALIPFTLQHTTLGQARAGVRVNLEYDIVAKYVEALLKGARGWKEEGSEG